MANMMQTFASLPRAAKWGLAALAVFAAYFVLVEPSLDATMNLRNKADQLELALGRANERAAGSSTVSDDLKLGAITFGDVSFPVSKGGSGALNKRISDVFAANGVDSWKSDERRATNLPRDTFSGMLAPNERSKKIVVDLDFQAHPITCAAVLADLERSPEVHSVSRVTLRKADGDGSDALRANYSVETWILSEVRRR